MKRGWTWTTVTFLTDWDFGVFFWVLASGHSALLSFLWLSATSLAFTGAGSLRTKHGTVQYVVGVQDPSHGLGVFVLVWSGLVWVFSVLFLFEDREYPPVLPRYIA